MRVFLDHSVSPNAANEEPLQEYRSALSTAAFQAPNSLKLLLERGADSNAPVPDGQWSPLDTALGAGAFGNVDVLRQARAKGLSDLAYASARGNLAKVNALLDQHADPNEANSAGWTPLFYAVRHAQAPWPSDCWNAGAAWTASIRGGSRPTCTSCCPRG